MKRFSMFSKVAQASCLCECLRVTNPPSLTPKKPIHGLSFLFCGKAPPKKKHTLDLLEFFLLPKETLGFCAGKPAMLDHVLSWEVRNIAEDELQLPACGGVCFSHFACGKAKKTHTVLGDLVFLFASWTL